MPGHEGLHGLIETLALLAVPQALAVGRIGEEGDIFGVQLQVAQIPLEHVDLAVQPGLLDMAAAQLEGFGINVAAADLRDQAGVVLPPGLLPDIPERVGVHPGPFSISKARVSPGARWDA